MSLPHWETARGPTLKDIYLPVVQTDDKYVAVVMRADAETLDLTARLVVCRPVTPKL